MGDSGLQDLQGFRFGASLGQNSDSQDLFGVSGLSLLLGCLGGLSDQRSEFRSV